MIENGEDTEAKLSVNMQKFRNEVDSVSSLLMAENERLTEIRDGLQNKVDTMRSRIESRPQSLHIEMTLQVDQMEKDVERKKVWERMQKLKAEKEEERKLGFTGKTTISSTKPIY